MTAIMKYLLKMANDSRYEVDPPSLFMLDPGFYYRKEYVRSAWRLFKKEFRPISHEEVRKGKS